MPTPIHALRKLQPIFPRRSPRNHSSSIVRSGNGIDSTPRYLFVETGGSLNSTQTSIFASGSPQRPEDEDREPFSTPRPRRDEFRPSPLSLSPHLATEPISVLNGVHQSEPRSNTSFLDVSAQPPASASRVTDLPLSKIKSATQEREELIDLCKPEAQVDMEREFKRLFVHLNRVTVQEQKSIASSFNVVQQGNKKLRAIRLFVVISGIMERPKHPALQVLEQKATKNEKDFKTEYLRTMSTWGVKEESTLVPPKAQVEIEGGVRHHPRIRQVDDAVGDESDEEGDVTAATNASARASLEEFARLMVFFRDVPEAAEDLRKSGQHLTREDRDTGRTRHAFLTDHIEGIFNDASYVINHKLDALLQHVDPGRPVTVFRDGSCLKDMFTKFRQEFTEIYGRWDVSGNMTFVTFCRLPSTKKLSRAGARCLIAFKIFQFGTANQNTLLLDFCSKQMAFGSGAQLESGVAADGPSGVTSMRTKKNALRMK